MGFIGSWSRRVGVRIPIAILAELNFPHRSFRSPFDARLKIWVFQDEQNARYPCLYWETCKTMAVYARYFSNCFPCNFSQQLQTMMGLHKRVLKAQIVMYIHSSRIKEVLCKGHLKFGELRKPGHSHMLNNGFFMAETYSPVGFSLALCSVNLYCIRNFSWTNFSLNVCTYK